MNKARTIAQQRAGDFPRMDDEPTRGTGQVGFSGHETFTLRHGWLKKAVDAVIADPEVFSKESAMLELGVGKNMVRSIRHWGLATQVLSEIPTTRGKQLMVTVFGKQLFTTEGDPYLEDLNTLWLLHWKLATNERRSTCWSWTFNLSRNDEFTRDTLFDLFIAELKRRNIDGPSAASIRRDIDCLIRTYVGTRANAGLLSEDTLECPLVEAQLISSDSDGMVFRFARGPKDSISPEIFLYCLLEFWSRTSQQDSLAFSEIAFAPGSPGAIFKLDENSIAARLEDLEPLTKGKLAYNESAGLRQVYRHKAVPPDQVLSDYYESALTVGG